MAKEDDLKEFDAPVRLEKLKKRKEEHEKEIAEAQKLISEAESEITSQREWEEKVPIPQVAAEDLAGLSVEEKQILKVQKGKNDNKWTEEDAGSEESPETIEKKVVDKQVSELEQTLGAEEIGLEAMQAVAQLGPGSNLDYVNELSQRPVNDLYGEIKNLYSAVQEKGYLSAEEHNRVVYLSSAMEQKVSDFQSGEYSFTKETARAASLSQALAHKMSSLYKGNDASGGMYQNANDY
ncbi:MAG: hypothetical protein ABIG93_01600 [archaeon]|nr:hypothetical protein [Nanoarchaeota archaeon]